MTRLLTFELNGVGYRTDEETLSVLRVAIERVRAGADTSALSSIMLLGLRTHRIHESRN